MLLVIFSICTVDPVSCTQLPMQLIICAGRSAPRITMSRSLSTLAGASFATVFFTDSCLIAVATNCRFVSYTLIMPGGSMAVAIVPRTFSDDYTSAVVCASCHILRCLRISGDWNENAIFYTIPWHITCHFCLAEPK